MILLINVSEINKSKYVLANHKKKVHDKIRNDKCDLCGKSFWSKIDIDISTVHESK